MMRGNTRKHLFSIAIALGLMATSVFMFNPTVQGQNESDGNQSALAVGIYDAEAVFEKHPAQEEMMEMMREVQPAMQEAQQQGNTERIQQLQQQYEQKRTQLIEQFEGDIDQAMPKAAKAAGVKVVAQDIVYSADDVMTRNITEQVIEALPGADQEEAAPQPPQIPESEQGGGQGAIEIPGQ